MKLIMLFMSNTQNIRLSTTHQNRTLFGGNSVRFLSGDRILVEKDVLHFIWFCLELGIKMYPTNRPFIMVNPSHMMNEMPLCINIRKEVFKVVICLWNIF